VFAERFEGQPLKRIALSFGGTTIRGEAIITRDGIEGGAIYGLSALLRPALSAEQPVIVHLDLRPDVSNDALRHKLGAPRMKRSVSSFLRQAAGLSPVAIGLLHEAALASGQALTSHSPDALAHLAKAIPIRVNATAPLARAISTAGGLVWSEVDDHFMLKQRPGVFVAGEMLDFDAPTGGYLLQAAFATGVAAGNGAVRWSLEERNRHPAPG
jgi:predicted flavoprotein YhiN